jgi:2-polyprenyl-3-methyl-5-hydroxy-6-metoxy-1,4-benzoquinol methylase
MRPSRAPQLRLAPRARARGAHAAPPAQPHAALLPPSLLGLRVLELGAGIGRFTGLLAATAARVHAVDFMPNLIEEARPARGACARAQGATTQGHATAVAPLAAPRALRAACEC